MDRRGDHERTRRAAVADRAALPCLGTPWPQYAQRHRLVERIVDVGDRDWIGGGWSSSARWSHSMGDPRADADQSAGVAVSRAVSRASARAQHSRQRPPCSAFVSIASRWCTRASSDGLSGHRRALANPPLLVRAACHRAGIAGADRCHLACCPALCGDCPLANGVLARSGGKPRYRRPAAFGWIRSVCRRAQRADAGDRAHCPWPWTRHYLLQRDLLRARCWRRGGRSWRNP